MASNKEIIYNYLKNKGLSDNAIAGVMGNIQQESNFSPTITNKSSGAYGLFQWLGGRKEKLQKYAKSKGTSAGNIYTQLDYFWEELNTSESKAKEVLTSGKYESASAYAVAFESTFERSGGSGNANRQKYSETILEEIQKGSFGELDLPDGGTPITTPVLDNGLKWWGDIVITVFAILLVVMGVVFIGLSVTSNSTGNKIVKKVAKGVVKNE